ncbi:hypothetical protein AGR6A_Lc170088 [Agrobacterium sp. NCPPB 925]|nr:hypothetical protein AGR6A_Lc170088 [Agrobacterium sp. NCPPB 925]
MFVLSCRSLATPWHMSPGGLRTSVRLDVRMMADAATAVAKARVLSMRTVSRKLNAG